MAERVLALAEALAVVAAQAAGVAPPVGVETVALGEARGRVLAEPVLARRDQPAFDRATRDGFAVRAGDLGGSLRVVGSVRAGEAWTGAAVGAGEAVEIMTGAAVPAGADAVLMVEHAEVLAEGLQVRPGRTLVAGENVVARGSEARAGGVVLAAGALLDAAALAAAAACGCAKVATYARAAVAVVATGDELVALDAGVDSPPALRNEQIFDSNSYALAALVEAGGRAQRLPIARDTLESLRDRLSEAREADLIVFTGGVSAGKFDLVEQALSEAGAEFFFTGVRIQPGKPVVFGRLPGADGRGVYFFGLPGNPVSTEVCFHLFVAPLLCALGGRSDFALPFAEATAAEAFAGKPGLVRFLPARIEGDWRGVYVRPVAWQGSGDTAANARANGYCVVEERGVAAGDVVRVLLR